LLGAILPKVTPAYFNLLTRQFANNGKQWDQQDYYDYAKEGDQLSKNEVVSEEEDWED